MKKLIGLSCAAFLLLCILTGCVKAQDLSTDEAVIAELQKRVDAKRAEMGTTGDSKLDAKMKNSSRLDARAVCIKRLKESPKVIVVGFFATDVGCRFDGAFIRSRYFEAADITDLSKAALEEFGWKQANQKRREKLAQLWVENGLLAFSTVLYTKDVDFGINDSAFHPPQTVSAENGEIKVTLWIQLPSGMRPERSFQYLEYQFAADGSFTGSRTLKALAL
ncbi:MAG TPA: hypothetical protein VM095_05440 [Pyrinomonadaceae bacterium]|nr:hypothetical protein [Pyrinomonadaceae bacterium]